MQEAERVQTEIQKVIGDDPTIQDASRIIVTVEKKSFWKGGKEIVVLKGSVHSESDKAKADRIAQLHAAGREVQDSIRSFTRARAPALEPRHAAHHVSGRSAGVRRQGTRSDARKRTRRCRARCSRLPRGSAPQPGPRRMRRPRR